MGKATVKRKISLGNRSRVIETPLFPSNGQVDYSGFGAHSDKNRRANRRDRKIEEKRVCRGDYD